MAYINSIIWKTPPVNMTSLKTRKLIPETNIILYYGMQEYLFFNRYGDEVRETEQTCEAATFLGNNTGGGRPYNDREYLGVKPKFFWRFGYQPMQDHIDSGRVYKKGNTLKFKQIKKGMCQTNLISTGGSGGEYPTQKPYKLLERIICLSTV